MSTAEKPKYNVIGTRPIRHDGADKVTGRALYGADVQPTGIVRGKILRSPHAHARIRSIDTSEAGSMDGVCAVVTAGDLPDMTDTIVELGEGTVNLGHLSANVLARNKVLYKGHAVAAVAAANPFVAQEALSRIRVEYEPLPAVTWILDAMKDDAPLLIDSLRTDSMGKLSDDPSNIAKHFHFKKGDVEQGFAEADLVLEREFRTETVHQGYIEPQVSTALWNEDGHITVWTATQGAFTARHQTAALLDIPISRVTVVPTEIGGGFGGKIAVYLEPVAALLSRKSGRPVQIAMGRDDVFEGTGPTPGSFMRVKLGAKKDGRLTAAETWMAFDAGGYPGSPIGAGCLCVFACYDVPHGKIDGFDVVLNKPKTQAYRAPGATQAAFACETVMDELAIELKIDPLELRLINAAKEGTRRVDGLVYARIGNAETLQAAKASEHYNSPITADHAQHMATDGHCALGTNGAALRGRGVATGYWLNAGLKSSAAASVNLDGTVGLIEGSTDIGGTRASVSMQLAETLGIAAEDVHPRVADTDGIGYSDVTGGSRVTYATGLAAHRLGLDIQRQMRERAALLWECQADDVVCQGNEYRCKDQSATFQELAGKMSVTGGPIEARASVDPEGPTNSFGTHIADIEVDKETGKVTILRYTIVQDAGTAIHPSYVEGQMQGGVVQGIGWALNEEYFFDDQGRMTNASFLDYRMPTALDVPMIDTIIVEVPNPDHPFGVRGVGEVPIVPPPAAIANAIYDAVGVRMRELPMSPPRLWKAMN